MLRSSRVEDVQQPACKNTKFLRMYLISDILYVFHKDQLHLKGDLLALSLISISLVGYNGNQISHIKSCVPLTFLTDSC